ncbi:hypothetical protein [Brevibacillus dissolubilis]|uniref:hypothetical protein n=1 Tax=Brevibacillus dissolubilis TaxID=1844116 RepID=UPI001116ADBC|nr:hypothetical protein [Brevibacillus dissolubilis]
MKSNPTDHLHKAMRSAKASHEVEGFTFTQQEDDLVLASLQGKLARADFLRLAKEMAGQIL